MAKKTASNTKSRRKLAPREPVGNRSLGRKMSGGGMSGASGALRARDEDTAPRVLKRGKSGPKSKLAPSGRPSGRRS